MYNSPLISIIIPVYNAERYLYRCLSFIEQSSEKDLSQIEIICINDGSRDSSLSILKQHVSKHSNFILIDQDNQGVSFARNRGLEIATGEYIFFIDSDDFLTEGAISILLKKVVTGKDIYRFSANDLRSRGIIPFVVANDSTSISDFLEHHALGVPFYIFKASIIKKLNLRFISEVKYAEDLNFTIKFISLINSAESISNVIYIYDRTNEYSAMNQLKNYRDVRSHIYVIKDLIDFFNTNETNNLDFSINSIMRLLKSTISFASNMRFHVGEKQKRNLLKDYKILYTNYLKPFFSKHDLSLDKHIIHHPLNILPIIYYMKIRNSYFNLTQLWNKKLAPKIPI